MKELEKNLLDREAKKIAKGKAVPRHVQVEQSGENRAGNAGDTPSSFGQAQAKLQNLRPAKKP